MHSIKSYIIYMYDIRGLKEINDFCWYGVIIQVVHHYHNTFLL